MKSIFETLIGKRVKNKLIHYAYEHEYEGSHLDLVKSIYGCKNIIEITAESIADVIQGEIEVLSSRNLDDEGNNMILFLAGLVHARDIITEDRSLIGKVDLE